VSPGWRSPAQQSIFGKGGTGAAGNRRAIARLRRSSSAAHGSSPSRGRSKIQFTPKAMSVAQRTKFGRSCGGDGVEPGEYAELVQAAEGAEVDERRAEAPAGEVAAAVTPGSRNL